MISIGNRPVGPGYPCFIIAEAGVNHNGNPDLAYELIRAAAASGADAVKFQTFTADSLVTQDASMADYQVRNTGQRASQYEMLRSLELPPEIYPKLKSYCDQLGIRFMSTPFDFASLRLLQETGVDCLKVSSGDLTNIPFLVAVARAGLPVILSSGMATLEECQEAIEAMANAGNDQVAILQCTTSYPCPDHQVNLRAMHTLKEFTGRITGFSDHSLGTLIPCLAVAAGASILEKHFTLDKNMAGPDHKASLEPSELTEMVRMVRFTEMVLGDGRKLPFEDEIQNRAVARKSVVTAQALAAGTMLTRQMLTTKRPGTGMHPRELFRLEGRVLKHALPADHLITPDDLL